jgi:hypothetical protein
MQTNEIDWNSPSGTSENPHCDRCMVVTVAGGKLV